jgi:hypothetical protein
MQEIDPYFFVPLLLAFFAAVLGLCFLADALKARRERRLATITAERIESEKAWALAEEVFAEVKPLVSDNDKAKVLRAIYARVKLYRETHP